MSANTALQAGTDAESEGVRERILEIAIHRFASQGYSETSTREIVEAAGCTKPALYYHFESKAGLFRSAVELAHRRVDGADEPEPVGLSFRESLRHSLTRLAKHVTANPDDLRLLFRADSYAVLGSDLVDTRSLRAGHIELASEILRAGIEAGEVRADLPVEEAAISLIGMLHLHLQLWLEGRPLADDFAERMVSIYMDGVTR
ncbi:MAG: TetR/AcrR family transcriptional regulator [Myxococcota bacterium]